MSLATSLQSCALALDCYLSLPLQSPAVLRALLDSLDELFLTIDANDERLTPADLRALAALVVRYDELALRLERLPPLSQ